MSETVPRTQTPYLVAEDELDRSLRPRRLAEFVGQQALREQLASRSRPHRREGMRSITCCWPARRASARPHWRRS
jgi:hypothetical protein